MLRFSQYLKENKEPQSPLHKKFLAAGYTHKWSGKPGDSKGDSKAYGHMYHHPDSLSDKSAEIKNKLDQILPGYEYYKSSHSVSDKDNKHIGHADTHNYYKGRTGNTVTTIPNRDGGHDVRHYYDHGKD